MKKIVIDYYLNFKTDVPPILGALCEGKESKTPLTTIINPELWNYHDGVSGMYPRASKYLGDQRIKLQAGINRELGVYMEAKLLDIELLGKCGVFW